MRNTIVNNFYVAKQKLHPYTDDVTGEQHYVLFKKDIVLITNVSIVPLYSFDRTSLYDFHYFNITQNINSKVTLYGENFQDIFEELP